MAAADKSTIVIKRVRKAGGGHHGGAWKIAYADFVTAMMAFFLLMWLISSTSKAKLEGIAEYFKTPLKVAMKGGPSVSERSSVIKGGGKDVTKKDGEVRKVPDIKAAQTELEKREKAQLEALKAKIEAAIDANPMLKQFRKQILLDITSEGLRIQVVDEQNRPMFATASSQLQPYTRDILREIGRMLNDVPNRIGLSSLSMPGTLQPLIDSTQFAQPASSATSRSQSCWCAADSMLPVRRSTSRYSATISRSTGASVMRAPHWTLCRDGPADRSRPRYRASGPAGSRLRPAWSGRSQYWR